MSKRDRFQGQNKGIFQGIIKFLKFVEHWRKGRIAFRSA